MLLLICQSDVEQKVGHSDILQGKLGRNRSEARVLKVHISYLFRRSTLLSLFILSLFLNLRIERFFLLQNSEIISCRFETSGSMIPLSVPEILPSRSFVMCTEDRGVG